MMKLTALLIIASLAVTTFTGCNATFEPVALIDPAYSHRIDPNPPEQIVLDTRPIENDDKPIDLAKARDAVLAGFPWPAEGSHPQITNREAVASADGDRN